MNVLSFLSQEEANFLIWCLCLQLDIIEKNFIVTDV